MNSEEKQLIEKLKRIEALFSGATTSGERDAAAMAFQRIQERLKKLEVSDPPEEYKFTMGDEWSRKLFVALLRRYNIKPFRYHRQRYTTVMAKVSPRFVNEVLWPEFEELDKTLREYLESVTNRVIAQGIHNDYSDAEVVPQLKG